MGRGVMNYESIKQDKSRRASEDAEDFRAPRPHHNLKDERAGYSAADIRDVKRQAGQGEQENQAEQYRD